jgi:hypothetical protein
MSLFSGASEDPEDDPVIEQHSVNAVYSAVKSLMHAIRTEDAETPQNEVHQRIQIAMPWMSRRWSESTLAN